MWGDIPAQHQRPRPEAVAFFAGVNGAIEYFPGVATGIHIAI